MLNMVVIAVLLACSGVLWWKLSTLQEKHVLLQAELLRLRSRLRDLRP